MQSYPDQVSYGEGYDPYNFCPECEREHELCACDPDEPEEEKQDE